jgi:malonyl-CoA decarboxylase
MNPTSFLRRLLGGRQDGIDLRTRELVTLCDALLAERAEFAGAALARDALLAYQGLDERGREEFFDVLARAYSPSPEAVGAAADAYRADPSPEHLLRLQETVEPARQELFRRLNMAPGGTATLVEMRRLLMKRLKERPQWRSIDADLLHLLRSWFNRGFLRLERIDWRTSAIVLEKLIRYEAVHAIEGWRDLRRRLESDRRCFAFFHPQLPDEPLIFIEVALTRGMSANVQPLLDIKAPVAATPCADCAMFYSITNCQEGLRGISGRRGRHRAARPALPARRSGVASRRDPGSARATAGAAVRLLPGAREAGPGARQGRAGTPRCSRSLSSG